MEHLHQRRPVAGGNSIAVGDFNGDGILDLAVADNDGAPITILLGKGDGTFTQVANGPVTGFYPNSIVVGDFNGDGIPDLAVAGEKLCEWWRRFRRSDYPSRQRKWNVYAGG